MSTFITPDGADVTKLMNVAPFGTKHVDRNDVSWIKGHDEWIEMGQAVADEDSDGVVLHGYAVKCPECEASLPVPVTVNITMPDDDGHQYPTFETDYTDIWAHNLARMNDE